MEIRGRRCLLHFFDLETEDAKYEIFALTAAILISAASVVYQKEPEFVVRSPELWHQKRNYRTRLCSLTRKKPVFRDSSVRRMRRKMKQIRTFSLEFLVLSWSLVLPEIL